MYSNSEGYSQNLDADHSYSYAAAGFSEIALTLDQEALVETLQDSDPAWDTVNKREIRALNRRFGVGPTTSALRSLVDQVRLDGLVARNPFALLWTATEERSGP